LRVGPDGASAAQGVEGGQGPGHGVEGQTEVDQAGDLVHPGRAQPVHGGGALVLGAEQGPAAVVVLGHEFGEPVLFGGVGAAGGAADRVVVALLGHEGGEVALDGFAHQVPHLLFVVADVGVHADGDRAGRRVVAGPLPGRAVPADVLLQLFPAGQQGQDVQAAFARVHPGLRVGGVHQPHRQFRLAGPRIGAYVQGPAVRAGEGAGLAPPQRGHRVHVVEGVLPALGVVAGVEDEVALVPARGEAHAHAAL
jgi:hypothetical protein